MTRSDKAKAFIKAAGWQDAEVSSLAGDASNRRYDRLHKLSGETAVLMDAPPEKGEDIRPFVQIASHLTSLGLSAPRILHQDAALGFLLIEDLGDRLFARELRTAPNLEETLYAAAVDVLTALHRTAPPALDRYDAARTTPLAALAYDWYQFGATGSVDAEAKQDFSKQFQSVIESYDDALTVLIQRDYHAENLLWLPDREAVRRVGLLDFQDAMIGHPTYDLVSVLQDARRDVSPETKQKMKHRFAVQNSFETVSFEAAYAVFGLQRNLRILGVFARLCLRDNKPHYVDLIPRVWAHVETNLRHPAVANLKEVLQKDLPAPNPDILRLLKEKSGAWAGR